MCRFFSTKAAPCVQIPNIISKNKSRPRNSLLLLYHSYRSRICRHLLSCKSRHRQRRLIMTDFAADVEVFPYVSFFICRKRRLKAGGIAPRLHRKLFQPFCWNGFFLLRCEWTWGAPQGSLSPPGCRRRSRLPTIPASAGQGGHISGRKIAKTKAEPRLGELQGEKRLGGESPWDAVVPLTPTEAAVGPPCPAPLPAGSAFPGGGGWRVKHTLGPRKPGGAVLQSRPCFTPAEDGLRKFRVVFSLCAVEIRPTRSFGSTRETEQLHRI